MSTEKVAGKVAGKAGARPGGAAAELVWHQHPSSARGRLLVWLVRALVWVTSFSRRRAQHRLDLDASRKGALALENRIASVPESAVVTPVQDAPVAGAWLRMPRSVPERVVLYIHGGSFILERTKLHTALAAHLCEAGAAQAFMVDYRLAPEDPFPAQIDDIKAAYRWLLAQGWRSDQIAFVGDSTGGGLALSALVSLRDEGARLPAAAVLLTPWADLTFSGASILTNARRDPMMHGLDVMTFCRQLYLQGASPGDPLASPVFAALHGLPPLLVQAADIDVLRDDAVRIGEGVHRAGGEVACSLYQKTPHGWQRLGPVTREGREAIEEVGAFLRDKVAVRPKGSGGLPREGEQPREAEQRYATDKI